MRLLFTLITSFFTFIANAQIPASGNTLWLKADVGVYNDYSGTTLATAGQSVGNWKDQSGSGNNITQGDPASSPSYLLSRINNKPILKFINAQTLVGAGSASLCNTDKQDIFTVFTQASPFSVQAIGSNIFAIQANIVASSFDQTYIFSNIAGVGAGIQIGPYANTAIFSQTTSTISGLCYKVVESRNDLSLTTNENSLYINGVFIAKRNTDPNANSTGNFNSTSQRIRVGDGSNAELDVAEIIVYNRILTATERTQVETYLNTKYFSGDASTQFTGLTTASQVVANTSLDDAVWKHIYASSQSTKIITSVKDNCTNLGTVNSTVYNDATASLIDAQYVMRRHFTIKPTLSPAGAKRVRLYYTNADFADLQTVVPTLTSASQLAVTKYTGPNEDGVFNPLGGATTFIPAAQITTGTAYGANYLEFDVTGFSEFWIHTGTTILPLKFLSFTTQKCNDKTVCLNWQTANEINVSHFEIERSINGITFTTVKNITAKNQASNSYTSNDDIGLLQNIGLVYYRIKQIDVDGKFTYSEINAIKLSAKNAINIYPNPAKDIVNIEGYYNLKSIGLYDMSGRKLQTWSAVQSSINITNLNVGNYILKMVLKSNEVVQEKIIKN